MVRKKPRYFLNGRTVHMFHLNKTLRVKQYPAPKKRAANYDKTPLPSPARRTWQIRTRERYDGSPPPTPSSTRKKKRHSNHDALPSPSMK